MGTKSEGRGKSQTLTIRISERTRFTLEALMRATGQSLTAVVERAIEEMAHNRYVAAGEHDRQTGWDDYWHIDEGLRTLRILAHPGQKYRTREEEELIEFVRRHWPFFAADAELVRLRADAIGVLWPHMPEYLQHWRKTRSVQPYATGQVMQSRLAGAGVEPPVWPPPGP